MSAEFVIHTAERTERRRFNKVLNNDLRKYIAEIVTNADDSYKRLVDDDKLDADKVVPIRITINKTKKVVVIVDNAEGMNLEELEENFSEYGADTSGGAQGKRVRGLFGQGATDVLLNAAQHGKVAEICSFKDGVYYTCKFKWNAGEEKKGIPQQPKTSQAQMRQIRSHYNIPENGTVIRFGIHEDIRIPRDIIEEIRTFYMLRFILADDKRNVLIRVISSTNTGEEKRINYNFPEIKESETLSDEDISFKYESDQVGGHLTIYRINEANSRNSGELKILVYDDEHNVYDNTLFGYDKAPGAESLHGYLELVGTSKIIRRKLNQRNAEGKLSPEEILTETRDGFSRHHEFYKSLFNSIEPQLREVLKKLEAINKDKSVSLDTQKDWNDAFKEINKYFEDGINAVNERIPVTKALETVAAGVNQVLSQYGLVR